MKRSLVVLALWGMVSGALAHDFWIFGENAGDKFVANIGFGHNFPAPEVIDEGRAKLFAPLVLVDKSGKRTTLKQKGENYRFEGKN